MDEEQAGEGFVRKRKRYERMKIGKKKEEEEKVGG